MFPQSCLLQIAILFQLAILYVANKSIGIVCSCIDHMNKTHFSIYLEKKKIEKENHQHAFVEKDPSRNHTIRDICLCVDVRL